MPKSTQLPTDPRFPAFRAKVEADYGGKLPDDVFHSGTQAPHEPYHTETVLAFRMFIAGWDAALNPNSGGERE